MSNATDSTPSSFKYAETLSPYRGATPPPKTWETMNCGERTVEVLLAPLKFILGLIEAIVVLIILFIGLFLENGPRELFIGEGILGSRNATRKRIIRASDIAAINTPTSSRVGTLALFTPGGTRLQALKIQESTSPTRSWNLNATGELAKQDSIPREETSRVHGKWVIYVPGMNSSIETDNQVAVNLYNATDVEGVICANPPGVGNSQGTTLDPEGYFSASAAAIRHIIVEHGEITDENPLEITLWGHSLGGGAAMRNANLAEFAGINIRVVLDRTFTTYSKAIKHSPLTFEPCVTLLEKVIDSYFPVDNEEEIRNTNREIVVIANPNDEVIDFGTASAITIESTNITAKHVIGFQEHSRTTQVVNDQISSLSATPGHSLGHTIGVISQIWNSFTGYVPSAGPADGYYDPLDL